jgi:hypothetical protein
MGKYNGVLLGACTAALVKIQILPQQIFTMAEACCFKNCLNWAKVEQQVLQLENDL